MNDSELYNRVIKVEVAKPHRGLAGLDSTLPGILLTLLEKLMCSMAARRMDQSECD